MYFKFSVEVGRGFIRVGYLENWLSCSPGLIILWQVFPVLEVQSKYMYLHVKTSYGTILIKRLLKSLSSLLSLIRRIHLRLAHIRGLVPVTSPCNKSRGQVPSCELAILASKSSRRYLTLVPETTCTCSPKNSNQFEFLGQVPVTCSSKRFVWTVRGTSLCDQSLRVNSSRN